MDDAGGGEKAECIIQKPAEPKRFAPIVRTEDESIHVTAEQLQRNPDERDDREDGEKVVLINPPRLMKDGAGGHKNAKREIEETERIVNAPETS